MIAAGVFSFDSAGNRRSSGGGRRPWSGVGAATIIIATIFAATSTAAQTTKPPLRNSCDRCECYTAVALSCQSTPKESLAASGWAARMPQHARLAREGLEVLWIAGMSVLQRIPAGKMATIGDAPEPQKLALFGVAIVSNPSLENIDPGSFAGLEDIRSLFISENAKLMTIGRGVISDSLGKLEFIEVRNNGRLTRVDLDGVCLPQLKELHLTGNPMLSSLGLTALALKPQLALVNLSGSGFSTIDHCVAFPFLSLRIPGVRKSLTGGVVGANRPTCTCHALSFSNTTTWYSDGLVVMSSVVPCSIGCNEPLPKLLTAVCTALDTLADRTCVGDATSSSTDSEQGASPGVQTHQNVVFGLSVAMAIIVLIIAMLIPWGLSKRGSAEKRRSATQQQQKRSGDRKSGRDSDDKKSRRADDAKAAAAAKPGAAPVGTAAGALASTAGAPLATATTDAAPMPMAPGAAGMPQPPPLPWGGGVPTALPPWTGMGIPPSMPPTGFDPALTFGGMPMAGPPGFVDPAAVAAVAAARRASLMGAPLSVAAAAARRASLAMVQSGGGGLVAGAAAAAARRLSLAAQMGGGGAAPVGPAGAAGISTNPSGMSPEKTPSKSSLAKSSSSSMGSRASMGSRRSVQWDSNVAEINENTMTAMKLNRLRRKSARKKAKEAKKTKGGGENQGSAASLASSGSSADSGGGSNTSLENAQGGKKKKKRRGK